MTDITIEADEFGRTLSQLLGRVETGVNQFMPAAVEKALDKGEKAWKKNATSVLSASYSRGGWGKLSKKRTETFKSGPRKGKVKSGWYGRLYKTGKYARSIKHQMLKQGGSVAEGEVGSASMPGLAHLLEKGHASIGGGKVRAHVHIEPASKEAFTDFEKLLDEAIEEALNEA